MLCFIGEKAKGNACSLRQATRARFPSSAESPGGTATARLDVGISQVGEKNTPACPGLDLAVFDVDGECDLAVDLGSPWMGQQLHDIPLSQ
jgi:hypothetical protein